MYIIVQQMKKVPKCYVNTERRNAFSEKQKKSKPNKGTEV